MQQGGGPDETRRPYGPGAGRDRNRQSEDPDATRRVDPDATRRVSPDGPGPGATRRMEGPPGGDGPVVGGRYRLEAFLGAGGMAEVHRATDLRLNRPVAVKIFRPGTDPDGEQRFYDEAQVLANLSHPGLVAVHDYGIDEDHRAYLVMELVDGQTLRDVLEQQLPLEEITRIGTDLADVLTYVHDQGVVHRDVKPSNILLGREGRVRLADFGIARLAGASGLTAADATLGTASYLAPEQVQGGRVGPPADVYALGLVLLEAVTGHVEYPGDGWEAASARLSTPPAVPDDLPTGLRTALVGMTDTDPERRPTAAQAADLLAGALTDEAVEEDAAPVPAGGSRRRGLLILAGVVVLIAIIAALALAGGDDGPTTAQPSAAPTAPEEPPPAEPAPEEEPADEAPADDPAPEDPAAEDPAVEDPGAGDPGGGLPDLPTFDPPDLPDASDLPDAPEIPEGTADDARNAWDRFVDWVSGWF